MDASADLAARKLLLCCGRRSNSGPTTSMYSVGVVVDTDAVDLLQLQYNTAQPLIETKLTVAVGTIVFSFLLHCYYYYYYYYRYRYRYRYRYHYHHRYQKR